MEKKPTRLLTNPPPCPKKKKKKKKKTHTVQARVCVCGGKGARKRTNDSWRVCVYRLAYSIRNFRHWLRLADTDKQQTDKQTNTQTESQTRQGHLPTPAVYRAVD
jgi:hypothetical protein